MKVVEPYAKIKWIDGLPAGVDNWSGICALKRVEEAGRVSHRSEERQDDGSWERFILAVVRQHGDWSITEHASVTVEALVDRGISHEWVRHRIGAYTQESTRFVKYRDDLQVVMPTEFDRSEDNPEGGDVHWNQAIEAAETAYHNLLRDGTTPQIARSVLPTCLATKLIVTYNLRNWRHFFLMRTTKEAHPQMRQVAIPLLAEFKEKIPLLYDDIVPGQRQVENLRLPR